MRIYIPAVAADLEAAELSARTVHAATAGLRAAADLPENMPAGEAREMVEAIAMNAAADDSLRMLIAQASGHVPTDSAEAAEAAPAPRRIVVAADVPDAELAPCQDPEQLPSALAATRPVAWDRVVAIHADDGEAEPVIAAALGGDDAAFERTYGEELMWYDICERQTLAKELLGR